MMLTTWWLNEMPAINGILRTIFYAGLLVICLVDQPSPLSAASNIAKTEQAFYTPPRMLRIFGISWVEPRVLKTISRLTVICWVLAALGFGQPIFSILTFLGFAFLHAVNSGSLGSNHSTHSALYALFCLCFSVSYDFSLDGLLATISGWPLLVPAGSVLNSGFAATLLLVLLSYTVFAGGIAKIRYGWRGWLDGSALRFYLQESAPAARWPWLSRLMIAHPWVCLTAAWGTLVVELGAILAILSPALRFWVIMSWFCLHIGILCVMMPAYWVQMWCYILLINWVGIFDGFSGKISSHAAVSYQGVEAIALVVLGCLACAGLIYTLVREIEQWPITNVPMYSNGTRSAELIKLPEAKDLPSRAAKAAKGHHAAWQRAWVDSEALEDIWLVPRDPNEPAERLFHHLYYQDITFVRWSQYSKVVRQITVADITAKPADPAKDASSAQYPGFQFLQTISPLVQGALADPHQFKALELSCLTSDGGVVVSRIPLAQNANEKFQSQSV